MCFHADESCDFAVVLSSDFLDATLAPGVRGKILAEARLRFNFSTHVPRGDVPKRHVPLRGHLLGVFVEFGSEPENFSRDVGGIDRRFPCRGGLFRPGPDPRR